jgi:hypothetical protein
MMDSADTPVIRQEPGVGCWCLMQILWPAFLLAVVADGLLLTLVHPEDIRVGEFFQGEPIAAHSVGFVALWILFAGSSVLTLYLVQNRMRALAVHRVA